MPPGAKYDLPIRCADGRARGLDPVSLWIGRESGEVFAFLTPCDTGTDFPICRLELLFC